MSNELSIPVSPQDLARVEAIATQCSFEVLSNQGHFIRAFQMAAGIRALREAITPAMLREIMSLQGSSLGFRTDKDSGQGYQPEIIKECAIEAALRGAHWVGNEFNIIAGRAYMTKEFFTRKLREFPGLTDLRLYPGVPAMRDGGALVPYMATWNLNGKPDRMERTLHKLENGVEVDERICVRVNSGMGADAILGKAERKIKAAIYARLTGSDVTEGEADEGSATRPLPRSLDDLTERLEGKANGAITGPAETHDRPQSSETDGQVTAEVGQSDLLTKAAAAFIACDKLHKVGKLEETFRMEARDDAERAEVTSLANQTRERLRAANSQQKELPTT